MGLNLKKRLDIANQVIKALEKNPRTSAVLRGSLASNRSDEFS